MAVNDYNLTNKVRDVFEAFEDLRVKQPTLLGTLKLGSQPTNVKHEWAERSLSETTTTVSSAPSPAASGTSITLASNTNVAQYDLLWFTSSTGQERSEVVQVTAVSTALTISREYGSSTASSIANNDIVHIIKPAKQAWRVTDLTARTGTAATLAFNYVQGINRLVEISEVAERTLTYGRSGSTIAEHLLDLVGQMELDMFREMNGTLINGFKVAPANTTTATGAAGGIKQFVAGGIENTTGGSIGISHFNSVFKTLYENGADPGSRYNLVMSPAQALKVSNINTSGTNPLVVINGANANAGYGAAQTVLTGLPGVNANVFIEPAVANDVIYVLDPTRFSINYMIPYQIVTDPTSVGTGTLAKILKATYTFEIKNGTTAHAKISGLDF